MPITPAEVIHTAENSSNTFAYAMEDIPDPPYSVLGSVLDNLTFYRYLSTENPLKSVIISILRHDEANDLRLLRFQQTIDRESEHLHKVKMNLYTCMVFYSLTSPNKKSFDCGRHP